MVHLSYPVIAGFHTLSDGFSPKLFTVCIWCKVWWSMIFAPSEIIPIIISGVDQIINERSF